jgi:spermidine synthase
VVGTIWKQTLKKLISQNSNLKTCLILGLGGGTVAKLVRKFWPEAKITGVDIDLEMIELGKKYLGLAEYGVKIIIADAYNFPSLPNFPDRKYDLIVVDLYNGDEFPEQFATENYIHLVRLHLSRSGMAIFNRLYYKKKKSGAEKFGKKLQKVFKNIEYYYPEANLMFICYN